MWSDFKAALWAMAEEQAAAEQQEPESVGQGESAFGRPPPDHILALVPHEAVPE